jgi:iron(II)-dependent oxidoreductase
MKKTQTIVNWVAIAVLLAAAVLQVVLTGQWLFALPVGLVAAWLLDRQLRSLRNSAPRVPASQPARPRKNREEQRPKAPVRRREEEVLGEDAPLSDRMIAQGRCALLLRPQIAANLTPGELRKASSKLDETMAIVPEGDVILKSWRDDLEADDSLPRQDRLVHVEAIYLDRHPVTNREFQKFVEDGGYEQMSLWDPKIWPAILDFVDSTGHPGPAFWEEGRFLPGTDDNPVVGVSWYEASAFARWVGKRLPSDPEWVKAGCWPVLAHGTKPLQRKYPWGDTMDRDRANLWGSGCDAPVSVYEFEDGVSVGGVYQLIGNVWEWTTSNFGVWDATARRLETPIPLKSIRGGAFDTYFDTQATCQFQSGENPVSRKYNIGFRCALALCDVVESIFDQHEPEQQSLVACGSETEEELV